jgi:TatD DNase family protein
MTLIDIHSHLHDEAFDVDRVDVLARMREVGVGTITVGTGLTSSRAAVFLAEHEADVWASVGVHPSDDPDEGFDANAFRELAHHPRTVAIGECGLDFFKSSQENDDARQRALFTEHIMLAEETGLPLMLHVRDAHEEILDIIAAHSGKVSGNVHFFAGDISTARKFLDLGFTLSFTGVISFTRDYDDVIRYIPEDMMMVETDAPYVAPVPYRGRRNEPTFVKYVIEHLAQIKNISQEDAIRLNEMNTRRVFPKIC